MIKGEASEEDDTIIDLNHTKLVKFLRTIYEDNPGIVNRIKTKF
jgi:hypothetical protein